jgi:hypothetical protein
MNKPLVCKDCGVAIPKSETGLTEEDWKQLELKGTILGIRCLSCAYNEAKRNYEDDNRN